MAVKNKYNPKNGQEFFGQFSKENLSKLKSLADFLKDEMEITRGLRKDEFAYIDEDTGKTIRDYENCDYLFSLTLNLLEEKQVNLTWHELTNLIVKIAYSFEFFDLHTPDHPSRTDRRIVGINKVGFDLFHKQLNKFIGGKNLEIYYQKAGIGIANGNNFKLRTEIKRNLFSELYEHINQPINRYEVLVLIEFYDENEEPNIANKSNETYAINKMVKELRKDIGLNVEQLININGNLTLMGTRVNPK